MGQLVERTCEECGGKFELPAQRLKSQPGRFCSRLCGNRAKANPKDPRARERKAKLVSITSKIRWQDPKFRAKMSEIRKMLWQEAKFRTRLSKAMSRSAKKNWQKEEYRQHQIEAQRKSWQNPDIVARRLAAASRHPNELEQKLISILDKHCPQFKYNGDFSLGVILGGLIPDFVNVNGKKELIELFGDYYHSPEVTNNDWRRGELGKIMIYNALGWNCLVIWEHELKELTEDQIINKVESLFSKRRHLCKR